MAVTTKIILKTDKLKADGTATFYFRITINRKVRYFSLNKYLNPRFYDVKSGQVKRGSNNAQKFNYWLEQQQSRMNEILLDHDLHRKILSFESIISAFQSRNEQLDFPAFCENTAAGLSIRRAPNTLKRYRVSIAKLRAFRPDSFTFADLDYKFCTDYENFLICEYGNGVNTIHKEMKFLRMMLNEAIRQGLTKNYPFKSYKLKTAETDRERLSEAELNRLYGRYQSGTLPGYLQNVLQYFLFACYTGLRFSDVQALNFGMINESVLRMRMTKTGRPVSIPLTSKAKALVPQNACNKAEKVFRTLTNQKTNQYLKEIASAAGIDREISFHCARHTFATIALTIGIPIEVVSDLLGHADLATTKVYAKIVDALKEKEMLKWEAV